MPMEKLAPLVGAWEGACRTWFEPNVLADESDVRGTFRWILGGRFLRHDYEGSIQGKPRIGEETIVFNQASGKVQVAWIDDFHSSGAILFSEGELIDGGFQAVGGYDVGSESPPWGWRTKYLFGSADELTITAYNVTPDGVEAKAVETLYRKVGD